MFDRKSDRPRLYWKGRRLNSQLLCGRFTSVKWGPYRLSGLNCISLMPKTISNHWSEGAGYYLGTEITFLNPLLHCVMWVKSAFVHRGLRVGGKNGNIWCMSLYSSFKIWNLFFFLLCNKQCRTHLCSFTEKSLGVGLFQQLAPKKGGQSALWSKIYCIVHNRLGFDLVYDDKVQWKYSTQKTFLWPGSQKSPRGPSVLCLNHMWLVLVTQFCHYIYINRYRWRQRAFINTL